MAAIVSQNLSIASVPPFPNNQGTCIYKKEMSHKLTEYIHTSVKFVNNIQVSNLLGA